MLKILLEVVIHQYHYKRVEIILGPSSIIPTINEQEPTIDVNMNVECEMTFDPNDWNVEDEKEEIEADAFGDQAVENGNKSEIGVCNETSGDE